MLKKADVADRSAASIGDGGIAFAFEPDRDREMYDPERERVVTPPPPALPPPNVVADGDAGDGSPADAAVGDRSVDSDSGGRVRSLRSLNIVMS